MSGEMAWDNIRQDDHPRYNKISFYKIHPFCSLVLAQVGDQLIIQAGTNGLYISPAVQPTGPEPDSPCKSNRSVELLSTVESYLVVWTQGWLSRRAARHGLHVADKEITGNVVSDARTNIKSMHW